MTEKIDNVINVYTSFNKFNGSVLVACKGKILLQKGYGLKNVQDRSANDPNTIFQIGSITKEFTAAIILKLIEHKQLQLTDKLSKFFPGFPMGDSIIIKNLLTHTSGIFNYTEMNDFWHQSAKPTNEQQVLDTIKKRGLSFSPGEKFSYSNSNYMLLAYVIQKVTHQPYETVLRTEIFQPLGMSQSGFDFTGLKGNNKAKGYWNLSPAKTEEAPPGDSTEYIGSGEIYSTVRDLYKWHRALQSDKILGKALLQQAYQPFIGKYGYGWELDTMYKRNIVGHAGRMFGFECKMVRVPEDDVFIILLNNCSDKPLLQTIARNIMAIIYQQPYTLPAKPLTLNEETLNNYTGIYGNDEKLFFEVRLINGHLFGIEQRGEKMMIELLPIKNNTFMFISGEGEEGKFEFVTDETGKPGEITTITPRGNKLILKKVR
jgi:CubicO group peptidase (beta-lactamase class C family)